MKNFIFLCIPALAFAHNLDAGLKKIHSSVQFDVPYYSKDSAKEPDETKTLDDPKKSYHSNTIIHPDTNALIYEYKEKRLSKEDLAPSTKIPRTTSEDKPVKNHKKKAATEKT